MVGVDTGKRKRGPFLALLVMLMILLRTARCGATTSIMKDNTTPPYDGRMDDPELMFDSEISRMLANTVKFVTPNTKNPSNSVFPCGRGKQYKPCVPDANKRKGPPPPNCDPTFRGPGC